MGLARRLGEALGTMLASAALTACSGTETGNPPKSVRVTVAATSSDPASVAIGPSQGGVSVEKAWISLASLSLLPCSFGTSPASTSWTVDLVHEPPRETTIITSLREYCGVRVTFAPAAVSPDVPGEVAGTSAFLSGKRPDGSPFQISSTTQGTTDLLPAAPSSPLTNRSVFLSFDLNAWLRGLGLDKVGRNAQGIVLIDAQTQPALAAIFDQQRAVVPALHDDTNENGRLDPGEIPAIASADSTVIDAGASAP